MDSIRNEPFETYVSQRLNTLKPAERVAAEYVLRESREILFSSADEIGTAAGTSDATVIRMAKSLGYSGLPELKRHASQQVAEQLAPTVRLGTEIARTASLGVGRVSQLAEEVVDSLEATRRQLEVEQIARGVQLLRTARAVHTWGIGASGIAAEYAALRFRRLGLDARWMSSSGFKLADELLAVKEGDAIVVIVPGRHHPDLDAVIDRMAELSVRGVLITSALSQPIRERFNVVFRADNSPSKLAGELYSSMMVIDVLVLELASVSEGTTLATSEALTRLRRRFS